MFKPGRTSWVNLLPILLSIGILAAGCDELYSTPVPPQEDCNPSPEEPLVVNDRGRLIYLLIESKDSYQSYRQEVSSNILPNVFKATLGPDDRVVMSWMEADATGSVEDNIAFNGSVTSIPTPAIDSQPLPQLTPTYTPDPNLIPGQPKEIRIQAELKAIDEANTRNLAKFHCNMLVPYYLTQQAKIDQWKATENASIDSLSANLQSSIQRGSNYKLGMTDALTMTSKIMKSECDDGKKYTECMILLFSNLDSAADSIQDASLDFTYSRVAIVMLNCEFMIEGCKTTKDTVSKEFTLANSSSICFITKLEPTKRLIDFIRSNKCNS